MDAKKIYDLLLNFSSNEQRGILIDGPWGIGKTHQIKRFLEKIETDNKTSKKKTKVIYSSLFGLESIYDLHTELYIKMNPVSNIFKNAIKVISPAFSLIPYAGETVSSSISYAIGKIDENIQKPKKKNHKTTSNKRIIIILDDIERVNSNFDYSSLLGYINQAYLFGLKIVCICDTTKIHNPGFNELKEKVFDRYYKVKKVNEKIIKDYFRNDSTHLDITTIQLFNNNLRTASKTSLFYFEIKEYMESLDNQKYLSIKTNIILWYVSLIVTYFNQNSMVVDNKEKLNDFDYYFKYFNNYLKDEDLSHTLTMCYLFDCQSKHIGKINDNGNIGRKDLLLSLAFAYLYDDYSFLNDNLKISDEVNDSYIPLFYLSTKDRTNEIKKIIDSIDSIEVMRKQQFERILSIFEWEELKNIDYDEKIIIDKIAQKCVNTNDRILHYFDFLKSFPKKTQEIITKIKVAYNKILIDDLLARIDKSFKSNDYNQICNLLNEINQKDYCHSHDNNDYDLIPEIKNIFIKKNYYLPSMIGTINENNWDLVLAICDFIYIYSFKESFSSYLLKLKNTSKDIDEKNRITLLLKKYDPNLQ